MLNTLLLSNRNGVTGSFHNNRQKMPLTTISKLVLLKKLLRLLSQVVSGIKQFSCFNIKLPKSLDPSTNKLPNITRMFVSTTLLNNITKKLVFRLNPLKCMQRHLNGIRHIELLETTFLKVK